MAKSKTSDLTDKQEMFCREYVIDFNGTQAAIRSGYSKNSANQIADQNLAKLGVQNFIKELTQKRSEKLEITADRVLRELEAIGFSRITDYVKIEERDVPIGEVDEEGREITINRKDVYVFDTANMDQSKIPAIASIRMTKDGIELKLHDKQAALESISKHIGFYEKDNAQQNKILPVSTLTPEQIKALDDKLNREY